MVRLPKLDLRFLSLGEADGLVRYATTMGDLLRHRWAQHELQVNRDFIRKELPEDECHMEMQGQQGEHLWFEQLLGAQVLLSAWAMLEGAVEFCSEYLAEQKGTVYSLKRPDKWQPALVPGKDVPTEGRWVCYYEKILNLEFPLRSDLPSIGGLRKLRNNYAHTLQLEDLGTGYRESPYDRLRHPINEEALGAFGEDPFTGEYPGRVFAKLADSLTKKLRDHVQNLYPHDGDGILFWHRRKHSSLN